MVASILCPTGMLHHVVLEECASSIFQGQSIHLRFVKPEDHSDNINF